MWKKSIIIVGWLITIAIIAGNATAVTVNPGVYYRQGNGEAIYGFSTTMQFNIITVTTDNVTYNTTVFNASCLAGTEVNITFFNFLNNYTYIFSYNNTGSRTWFNLSGLPSNIMYTVYHNGTVNETVTTDVNGDVSLVKSDDWNGTILMQRSATDLRVTGDQLVPDVLGIADAVITLIGFVLIISAILGVIIIIQKYR